MLPRRPIRRARRRSSRRTWPYERLDATRRKSNQPTVRRAALGDPALYSVAYRGIPLQMVAGGATSFIAIIPFTSGSCRERHHACMSHGAELPVALPRSGSLSDDLHLMRARSRLAQRSCRTEANGRRARTIIGGVRRSRSVRRVSSIDKVGVAVSDAPGAVSWVAELELSSTAVG